MGGVHLKIKSWKVRSLEVLCPVLGYYVGKKSCRKRCGVVKAWGPHTQVKLCPHKEPKVRAKVQKPSEFAALDRVG